MKEYNEQNNKKGKTDKKEEKEKETTNIVSASELASPSSTSTTISFISTPPLYKRFMFDLDTSLYMTNDIGCFKTFSVDQRTIDIANSKYIYYIRKGMVILNCKLPDGSLSLFHLNYVLFIPILSKSVFS